LIGVPLAYQYLTTLRPTEIPLGVDPLLQVRGRGWLVGYPAYINADPDQANHFDAGMPLVSSMRWDTGLQAQYERTGLGASVALTAGSLSNPRVGDDNDGKQIAGRLTWQPRPAIDLGLSLSRGAFLARAVTNQLPASTQASDFVQTAWGVDAEISSGYWTVRAEVIRSRWRLPAVGPIPLGDPLDATGLTLEGRYRVTPRVHVALRGERLGFASIRGTVDGGQPLPWDAPVSRIEVGGGFAFSRHVSSKVAWQYNRREGVSRPRGREGFLAAQVAVWF
jgi:hypothetical protein